MANENETISQLDSELSAADLAADDLFPAVDTSAVATKRFKAMSAALGLSKLKYFADTGGDDAYVVSTGLALAALTAGFAFAVKCTTANTGAATLAIDSAGAIAIKKNATANLATGDITAGMIALLIYDGTYLQLLNPAVQTLVSVTYVDIPIICQITNNFGAQSTNYCGLGGSLTSAESSAPYSPFGITGTVREMYIQAKTNTMSDSTVITLMSGAADAASLTLSNLAVTLAATIKNSSVTNQTLDVTPTKIGGFKLVNTSGSGSITLITITLVVRVSLG